MSRLVVYVPGIGATTSSWQPLLQRLQEEPQWKTGTRFLGHDHGATVWSHKSADKFAAQLAEAIETDWEVNGRVDEVVLLGHSMGALIVRQAYLTSLNSKRTIARDWAGRVTRIVLYSGINRGVELSRYLRALVSFILPGERLTKDLLTGSDFVTNLRISWIRRLAALERRPVVLQVRGGHDSLVHKDDSIDVEGFLERHQLTFESARHRNLILPDRGKIFRRKAFSDKKYSILRYAAIESIPNSLSQDRVENSQQKIVFVLHGIRDSNNAWAKSITKLIENHIASAEVITPSFGRFSALQFALPILRRSKVRWFQDLYSMRVSMNPLAKFYFVGHSYGTFVLGHGLEHLPGLEFEKVLLAGSVLPEEWPWLEHMSQVREVRNCRAQYDVPVAILCKALRGIGLGKGIGTAGYTGFFVPFGPGAEQYFYDGGHSATVVPEQAQLDIVRFLEKGNSYIPVSTMVGEDTSFTRLSAVAPVLGYILLLLCVGISIVVNSFSPDPTLLHLLRVTATIVSVVLVAVLVFLAFY